MDFGLISDTHGLLRPQARAALAGCAHILHAGDVGADAILDALAEIAPLTAVRGNNDRTGRAGRLRDREWVELCGIVCYVVHDLADLDIDPPIAGVHVVVSGHSHRPRIARRAGVLYVNPGSAGPRRFTLPVSVAKLAVGADGIEPTIVELDVAKS